MGNPRLSSTTSTNECSRDVQLQSIRSLPQRTRISMSSEIEYNRPSSQASTGAGPSQQAEAIATLPEPQSPPQASLQSTHSTINASASLSRWMLAATVLSLIGMIIFGVGAWAGMNFANFYAKKAYELDLWEKCQAFQYIQQRPACKDILSEDPFATLNVKRELDLGKTMEFPSDYRTELCRKAWLYTVHGWNTLIDFITGAQYSASTAKRLCISITTSNAGKWVFHTINKHASRICITLSAFGSLIGFFRVISSNLNMKKELATSMMPWVTMDITERFRHLSILKHNAIALYGFITCTTLAATSCYSHAHFTLAVSAGLGLLFARLGSLFFKQTFHRQSGIKNPEARSYAVSWGCMMDPLFRSLTAWIFITTNLVLLATPFKPTKNFNEADAHITSWVIPTALLSLHFLGVNMMFGITAFIRSR